MEQGCIGKGTLGVSGIYNAFRRPLDALPFPQSVLAGIDKLVGGVANGGNEAGREPRRRLGVGEQRRSVGWG